MTELELRMTFLQFEVNDAPHRIAEGEGEELDWELIKQVRARFSHVFNFGIMDVFNTFFRPNPSKEQCERLADAFPDELRIYKKSFLRRNRESPSPLTILSSIT